VVKINQGEDRCLILILNVMKVR